jgi:hypothetical protein
MIIEDFKRLCQQHDLTYSYSDDHRYWRAGFSEWNAIRELADLIGKDVAAPIWNEVVDQKIAEESRHLFYWKTNDRETENPSQDPEEKNGTGEDVPSKVET